MDLCELDGDTFLVVVDAYSFYWEIARVRSATMKDIARALFSTFSQFGFPVELRSDNGPQMAGSWLREILQAHGVRLITSSPYHPRGNSLAERAVQEAKKLLKKYSYGTPEFFTALLEWRNVPRSTNLGSPMQRLMGRQARTTLPMVPQQLRPRTIPPEVVVEELEGEKRRNKAYYDQGTRALLPLREGQPIRMLHPRENIWKRGTVV